MSSYGLIGNILENKIRRTVTGSINTADKKGDIKHNQRYDDQQDKFFLGQFKLRNRRVMDCLLNLNGFNPSSPATFPARLRAVAFMIEFRSLSVRV